jgi:hypothetical protein
VYGLLCGCHCHYLSPHRGLLRHDHDHGAKWTYTAIDEDYSIEGLDAYLGAKSRFASRLIWCALISADGKSAKARFRPNQQYVIRENESRLAYALRRHDWIPDNSGAFHKPEDMTQEDLRTDFPYDDRSGLLTAIGFGDLAKKRSQEYQARNQVAKEMGFASADVAEELARLITESGITPDEIRALAAQRKHTSQPEDRVSNAQRRRKGVLEHKDNAPEKESVKRERSIQPGIAEIVAQAKAYLRAKYTNAYGQMVCQACKQEMPFRLPSGDYYFEAVQCIKKVGQHFFENRLALCPTCSAMYQYARGDSDEVLKQAIVSREIKQGDSACEIDTELAGTMRRLRFVGTHFFDLRTVLEGGEYD